MDETVVDTSYGKIRGSLQKSFEGYDYYAFKGIPYAKPPVGDLRFQDPQPPEPWKGIREATEFGSPCAQYDQITRNYIGDDDCLYLNVYVKSLNSKTQLPVMFWIHGGAFTFGCSDDLFYGPDYLLRKDIVLVTINYRLGVFGFLNLEDEVAPGNQGLKDQVMALKWVQKNIHYFGGDPKNVTAFGESSGGSSVNLLGLSSMSKDLFHKAISQSGVALNTWVSTPNPKQYAYRLCKFFGHDTEDPEEIVEILRKIDSSELVRAQEKIRNFTEKFQLLYPFGPGVDDKSKDPFMPIPVTEAAKKGMEVPYLLGYNNREGIYALQMMKSKGANFFDDNFDKLVHPHLNKILQEYDLNTTELRRMYDSLEMKEENYTEKIVDLLGDMYVVEGYHKMVKYQVLNNKAPVFFYKFTFDQGISLTKYLLNETMSGASHFDELPYLFSIKFFEMLNIDPIEKGTISYKLMEKMTEMWTNFARTGTPTPVTSALLPKKWNPVTNPIFLNYMNIDSELNMSNIMNLELRLSRGKPINSKL